jgi:hypothetical protein
MEDIMNRNTLFWGLVLILAGGVFLLSNLGIITVNIWQIIGPVLLILIGLRVLLGAFFKGGDRGRESVIIPLDGASSARVRIEHGAGRLSLDASASHGELASGMFTGGLDFKTRPSRESMEVVMKVPQHSFPALFFPGGGFQWDVGFNREVPLYFDINTGANEAHINLEELLVRELRLGTGASATRVIFPARAGYTRARIESGAASVHLIIPLDVVARIKVDSGLAGIDIDPRRFPRSGRLYESPGYESAQNKVDIEISTGVANVTIR